MNHNNIVAILLVFCSQLVKSRRNNIVLIITDDQDVVLGGLTPLKKTTKLIGEGGTVFSNAFATTPLCCPSRSSILTGLYLHSHKTVNNTIEGGCSNLRWQNRYEPKTFGAILHRAGYKTFYAGKYLNKYGYPASGGVKHVPRGWDWWIGLVGNSVYYNYTLSVNGTKVEKGDSNQDYLTDVIKEYSLSFLNERRSEDDDAFLMVINPPSPHEPFTPASRHVGKYSDETAPRVVTFNKRVQRSKHWLMRLPPKILPQETVEKIDEVFRKRWETLLSVDEMVEAIICRLKKLRLLNKTYIIFTSDHGFHLGQYGQPWDKRQPYETDIRIPLMIRGPRIPKQTIDYPVLNIDFAPTILDMAGINCSFFMDGKSILPVIRSQKSIEISRTFLIEYRGEYENKSNSCYNDTNLKSCDPQLSCKCFDAKNNSYNCLRHLSQEDNNILCSFDDDESFKEFYDMNMDPYQMLNLWRSLKAKMSQIVLECCKRKIELNKAVDECLDYKTSPEAILLP